jgi:hypothetical protein
MSWPGLTYARAVKTRVADCVFFIVMAWVSCIVMVWPGAANPGRFHEIAGSVGGHDGENRPRRKNRSRQRVNWPDKRDRERVGRHFSVMTISNPAAPAASLSQ